MKKHEGILKRVRYLEQKYDIRYAKVDGRLYKGVRLCYILAFVYTLIINLIRMAGDYLLLRVDREVINVVTVRNTLSTVAVCTAVSLLGFILIFTRLKATGAAIGLMALPMMVLGLARQYPDDFGFLELSRAFYLRHFIGIAIMAIALIWLLAITVRAKYKENSQYKRIVENLYENYRLADGEEISEDEWDRFLDTYDPRDLNYKKQFRTEQESEAAEK